MDNDRKKYSLVVDARMINTSGIGTVCQNILPYLLSDFQITLMGNPEELKMFDWVSQVKIISLQSSIYSLSEHLELFLKVPYCDFLLSPHYNVTFFPVKAKARVVIIHDVNHIALGKSFDFLKKSYARLVIQYALAISDKIITVSKFSKSEIVRYFKVKENAIFPITLGVNTSLFKVFSNDEKVKIRSKYLLPQKFLLYVGNVKPHKNLTVLIKAFANLKDSKLHSNLKLVIVGKKEGFITADQSIANEITDLHLMHDILFTGYVPNHDLPVIYNLASTFVFPSLYEGFGLPPIEAMACGCPTVVSNSSSLPEVCQNASLYFNPHNPEELATAISHLLTNDALKDELRHNGFRLVEKYKWENTAKEIKEIILFK